MSEKSPASPVNAMFGRIAGVYDFLNHFLSLGIDRYWRRELAGLVTEGENGIIADLAAGTLDVALVVLKAHPNVHIPAVDFCQPMLERGLKKLHTKEQKKRILPCMGDATALPFADNSVDSLTMAFGIRNINPRKGAFKEMLRVLAPGGRACILEFGSGQERIWGGLYNFYLEHILPRLGALYAHDNHAYSYLSRTIKEFPHARRLAEEMEEAGFEAVNFRKLSSGIVCLHWGHKVRLRATQDFI